MEIIPTDKSFSDNEGKKWLPVNISFDAISQINKIVLGDHPDQDDSKAVAKRNQVHEDVLELIKLFNN